MAFEPGQLTFGTTPRTPRPVQRQHFCAKRCFKCAVGALWSAEMLPRCLPTDPLIFRRVREPAELPAYWSAHSRVPKTSRQHSWVPIKRRSGIGTLPAPKVIRQVQARQNKIGRSSAADQ